MCCLLINSATVYNFWAMQWNMVRSNKPSAFNKPSFADVSWLNYDLQVRGTGSSKLPVGVHVRVRGCLSGGVTGKSGRKTALHLKKKKMQGAVLLWVFCQRYSWDEIWSRTVSLSHSSMTLRVYHMQFILHLQMMALTLQSTEECLFAYIQLAKTVLCWVMPHYKYKFQIKVQ